MVSKSTSVPRLVVVEGSDKGKVIDLKHGTVIIGRSKGDVIIHDPRMSRSHTAIHFDSKTCKLSCTDLQSLNGTYVNGKKIDSCVLDEGDQILIGDSKFDCQLYPHEKTGSVQIKKFKDKQTSDRMKSRVNEPLFVPDSDTGDHSLTVNRSSPISSRSSGPQVPSAMGLYLSVPGIVRRIGLVLILVLSVMFYFALDINPSDPTPEVLAAIKDLAITNRVEEAIAKAEAQKTDFPEGVKLHVLLGELYLSQERYDLGVLALERAHTLDKNNPSTHVRLTNAYVKAGKLEAAKREFGHVEEKINEVQDNREFYIDVAKLLIANQQLEPDPDQVRLVARTLQKTLAPKDPEGYKLEAQLLFQQKEHKRALSVLEKARAISSQDEWVIENIALTNFRLKDFQSASIVVEDWIKLNPRSTKALLVMAYLKFSDKKIKDTLTYLQRLFRVAGDNYKDPFYAEALNLAGEVYLVTNRKEDAAKFIEQACTLGYKPSCQNREINSKKK